jgi:hypothetical protein
MCSKKQRIAATVLVGVLSAGIGWAADPVPGDSRRTEPAASRSAAVRLSPTADLIYQYVEKHPGQFAWQRIPWLVDLPEAIHQSKEENRPVLLFVSADDPLERC